MHFQFVVAAPTAAFPLPPIPPATDGQSALLRELIDVQKEQLAYVRAAHEAQNMSVRWQGFLTRWGEEFPDVGPGCLQAMPQIERAFLRLLDDMTRRLSDEDVEGIDDEFSLGEFLDRYGIRLGQLGNVLNVLGPLAEAARTMDANAG
jgi:hypothetical protein